MALYYDLPVYRDTYQLVLKVFAVTKDFPKDYKYTLGQDMKRDALQLVRSIYRANRATHKKEHLDTFLDEFELLKRKHSLPPLKRGIEGDFFNKISPTPFNVDGYGVTFSCLNALGKGAKS